MSILVSFLSVCAALGLVVVGWFLKSYFPSYLDQKAKNLATKEDIADITAKIEGVRTELRRAAFEHEVRYSRLHERRVDVIAGIYRLLVRVTWEAHNLANPMQFVGDPTKMEKYHALQAAIARYFRFFDQRRIFLPADLCQSLEEFAKAVRTPTFGYGVYLDISFPNEQTKKDSSAAAETLWNFVQNDVPKMREAIETRFRILLGAEPESLGHDR